MAKGSDFERYVCKKLSVWFQGTEKPYLFWRMPASGGLATISEMNKGLAGDIIPLDEDIKKWWPLSIECKTGYPSTSFWQHFKGLKNFNIELFWKQCTEDAKKSDKYPMLIYRKKGQKPIVGINEIVEDMFDIEHLPSISLYFPKTKDNVVFYDMEQFFNNITPEQLKEQTWHK